MKRITLSSGILSARGASMFYPGGEYLIPDEQRRTIIEEDKRSGFGFIASEEAFNPTNWKNTSATTLLVWNTGRLGDQLWTTAIIRKIKSLYPACKIDVVCQDIHRNIYLHNKDIRSFRSEPVPASILNSYDAYLIYDETVAKSTSGNCYELLFKEAALPFSNNDCKPILHLKRKDELEALTAAFANNSLGSFEANNTFVLLGLASEANTRNITAAQWANIIRLLEKKAADIDGFKIFGISYNAAGYELQRALQRYNFSSYVSLHTVLSPRHFAALARIGMLVISVDTSYLHLAAAVDCPTVALMSTVPPECRTTTYPACVNIYNRSACAHAPCHFKRGSFSDLFGDELTIAPCYTPQRIECDILASLTTVEISNAIDLAIESDPRPIDKAPLSI